MTFSKFNSRRGRINSSYWLIGIIRFFVRLFGTLTALYWLNILSVNLSGESGFYTFLSSSFYVLFFVFLDWYIKVNLQLKVADKAIKWLNRLKWIPLIITLVLVCLSFLLNDLIWPEETSKAILYAFVKAWPLVIVPNLSFIIITLLIFYTSAILQHNKILKQENDLTI